MLDSGKTYLPAAGHDWLLPLYDPLVKLLGGDTARRTFLEQATIQPGHRVLDIGSGTGALAMLIKRLLPDVQVVGLVSRGGVPLALDLWFHCWSVDFDVLIQI